MNAAKNLKKKKRSLVEGFIFRKKNKIVYSNTVIYRRRNTHVIKTKFLKSVAGPQNCETYKLLTTDHPTKILIRCHQITFVYIFKQNNYDYS